MFVFEGNLSNEKVFLKTNKLLGLGWKTKNEL